MRYLIVNLLNEPAKSFNEKLIKDVAHKFNVFSVLNKNAPAHITLKYGFETNRICEIESVLDNFCKNNFACTYNVENYGSFNNKVIFLKIKPSDEFIYLHKNLMVYLKRINWLTWHPNFDDVNIHFHASIAHEDINESNFDEIFNFVSEKKVEFKLICDNIAILKFEENCWKVHKIFYLKKKV
jgi:2'-5' RNA ligase